MNKPHFSEYRGDPQGFLKAKDAWKAYVKIPQPLEKVYVHGPERVVEVEVERRVEVPVESAETKAKLERAEADLRRVESVLAKAQQVPPQPDLAGATAEEIEFVHSFLHDGEAYGDAEARLVAEASALNNRLMSGMIDGAERDRLKVLTRLFTVTKRIAVDAL